MVCCIVFCANSDDHYDSRGLDNHFPVLLGAQKGLENHFPVLLGSPKGLENDYPVLLNHDGC